MFEEWDSEMERKFRHPLSSMSCRELFPAAQNKITYSLLKSQSEMKCAGLEL